MDRFNNFDKLDQIGQQIVTMWFGPLIDASIKFASIAVLILLAFFLAGVVKTLITKLFHKLSIDKKVSQLLWANIELADVVGILWYYLIILLFMPGILQSIGLGQMVAPIQNIIDTIASFIPKMISATVIAIVFYTIAKIIADIISKFTTGIDLTALLSKIGINGIAVNNQQLWHVLRGVIFTIVLLVGSSQIFGLLGLSEVGYIVNNVIQGIGGIILGWAIIWLGFYLANTVSSLVSLSSSQSSRTLSMICKYGIIVFAILIGLDKIWVPSNLINLLVMVVFGSVGLGCAIAIGLGAKDTIGDEVKNLIHNIKKNSM